jgi:hypothetical protein
VAPLLQDVPQRLRDEQLLRSDDAGVLRDGGVGGVVGSGWYVLGAEEAYDCTVLFVALWLLTETYLPL